MGISQIEDGPPKSTPNITRAVNILGLKRFARESLSGNSPLKGVLLSEKDQLTPNEFLAKMDVWVALLNLETANA
jgi:hypothetical protein